MNNTTIPQKRQRITAQRIIYATLVWSKAFVPVIALLAAIASSVRTVQTTSEIYAESGSAPWAVPIAALAFTLSVEGALFILALAQAQQEHKWRMARKKRRIMSLKGIWRSVQVRIGTVDPLSYDQLPDSDRSLGFVVVIAFAFAVFSNFNIGLRPLIKMLGDSSLQALFTNLLNAQAHVQMAFVVDLAAVIFPPLMALKAGHLAARYALEVSASQQRINAASERIQKPSKPSVEPVVERSVEPQLNATERSEKRSSRGARERVIAFLNEYSGPKLSQNRIAQLCDASVGTVNAVIQSRVNLPENAPAEQAAAK
jgi:hypothetical protein